MGGDTLILGLCGIILIIFILIAAFGNNFSLNGIKRKSVGDGQHGTARFAAKGEIKQELKIVPYEPEEWRLKKQPPVKDGLILGMERRGRKYYALVDTKDNHTLMNAAPGGGKTTRFTYPNIEFTCACGTCFFATDTKGDVQDRYAFIAEQYYGYHCTVIDFSNPLRSDCWNLLSIVNKYIARYQMTGNVSMMAKAEKSAKITAGSIIGKTDMGSNSFFYQAAEGLIAGIILLIAEFAKPEESHIVSVFKITLELISEKPKKGEKMYLCKLFEKLPPEHKARWLASSAVYSPNESMFNVISTAISRMLSFIDSETEQILCFDSKYDFDGFDRGKNAVFINVPEEDKNKHFLLSLIVEQTYGELLRMAGENRNVLHKRVRYFLDEFGTMPPINNIGSMFSAGRSRGILLCPSVQELAQLGLRYGNEEKTNILGCCQNVLAGGFSPLSEAAKEISNALDKTTVQSGSVSVGGGVNAKNSRSLQMVSRLLMSPDELKNMPKGDFICMKSGMHPFRTHLEYYEDLGISFPKLRETQENAVRTVKYANLKEIEAAINKKYGCREAALIPEDEPELSRQAHSIPKRDPNVWNM